MSRPEYDGEEGPDILDYRTVVCARFFGACVQREFPSVRTELTLINDQVVCWFITIPVELEDATEAIDGYCYELMNRIFWEKDELVTFSLLRASEHE